MEHDEYDAWDDDELVRALRAPGTPSELAGEAEILAAYRTRGTGRTVGRIAGRFGVGATAIAASVALSGGVAAAAYTQTLPDPVQRFAHGVLGPVGVPAPEKPRPRPETPPSAGASRTQAPDASPGAGEPQAPATRTPTAPGVVPPPATPTATPGAPTSTPEPTDAPSPPAPGPPVLTATPSATRVTFGGTVTVSGTLTADDGTPLANRTVGLGTRVGGQPWRRVAVGRTDASGAVTLVSRALTRNTSLRLAGAEGLRSAVARVVVVPVVQATAEDDAGTTTIRIACQGVAAGDTVVLYRRQASGLVEVARTTADASGSASFVTATPKRLVRVVVRVLVTPQHGRGQDSVTIGVAAPRPVPTPAPAETP